MNYETLHKLAFLKRDEILKNHTRINFENFSNLLGEIEQDPFIGFVGEDFENEEVKVLFLGKSNAPSTLKHHEIDRQINSALQTFKNSQNNYRAYANKYLEAMPRWDIMQFVTEFRNQTHLKLNQIAYANIVPWRYDGSPNGATYELGFKYFTNQFIEAIEPNLIIPLGSKLKTDIKKYLYAENEIHISNGINRSFYFIGRDKRITEEGWQTISEAVDDYFVIKDNFIEKRKVNEK